tara:strand:+ start:2713 stop:3660 length:948 start_codon:yes stop_codon:yes gene_type:complete
MSNGHSGNSNHHTGTWVAKSGLAQMLKGGVIMDVTSADEAIIAEEAGAVAVMALERVPADIRMQGGVARMAPVSKMVEIRDSVSIPVMAKCRIGHFAEARIIESLELDYIDESEVLTPADPENHVDKNDFKIPFVCGALDLGQALRRIAEGAAMIRTKGEAGTGDIIEAVRHMRTMMKQIRHVASLEKDELITESKALQAPYDLVKEVHRTGRLPVVNFAAGGIATPADAALMMHLGAEGNFVGSGIFKAAKQNSDNDEEMQTIALSLARAIVDATMNYKDFKLVADVSKNIDVAMSGISSTEIPHPDRLASRGH